MSTSTNFRVSDAERNDAISTIQAAYADGRLDESHMERRLDLALGARTRLELSQATDGLVHHRPLATYSAPGLPIARPADGPAAGLTHLSALPFGPFGPAAVWLFSGNGTAIKREAAKALNFQVIALVVGMVLGIVSGIFNLGFPSGVWGVAWFVLTVVSGVKAWNGQDWENPVTQIVGKRLVDEHPSRR